MKTISLFQEFDVTVYEDENWQYDSHGHNFFELIFILKGNGTHIINQNRYDYKANDLFFLIPGDEHNFDVKSRSIFCIVLFNKIYFTKNQGVNHGMVDYSGFFKKIEFILHNAHYLNKNIFQQETERKLIEQYIRQLCYEHQHQEAYHELIVQSNLFIILCLIARKVKENLTVQFLKHDSDKDISEIIFYIQDNIYNPVKLKVNHLAEQFHKSRNHFSVYFKNNTGSSVKEYIQNYKVNLIKHRLTHSNLTISEIAFEFGFSDESHLNKLFKQRNGITAKEYRKSHLRILPD